MTKDYKCCPEFNPEPWNNKEIIWDRKKFVTDKIKSIFRVPLNFSKIMIKNMALIEDANAKPDNPIILSDEDSLWGSNIFIDITKDVPNTNITTISGTFLTKVFEGSYSNTNKWINEMKEHVQSKGKKIKKMYFYYTTCPKCAKKYGKNYVVILAKV